MRPLATTHLLMTWLSMCPADEPISRRQKICHVANTLTALIANLIHCTAGAAYCLRYFSVDFSGAAFAVMAAIGTIGLDYSLIMAIQMREQIGDIFRDLTAIHKTRKF